MDRISDLRTSLCKSLSRDVVEHVAASVAEYPDDIPQLIRLLDDTDNRVAWRAAWACEKLSALSPDRLLPHREEIARRLFRCQHDGTKRLLLSVLYRLPPDESFPVELYNYCIEHMVSPAEKAAVQALCIKTAFRLGKREPELLWELKFYLENAQTQFYSPAFISARKNVLRHIYSLHKK